MTDQPPTGYVWVMCSNPECSSVLRKGKGKRIGFAKPGSDGGWWCGQCRRYSVIDIAPLASLVAV